MVSKLYGNKLHTNGKKKIQKKKTKKQRSDRNEIMLNKKQFLFYK